MERCKTVNFAYIKDRVWKNLEGWKGKLFSAGGKETPLAIRCLVLGCLKNFLMILASWQLGFGGKRPKNSLDGVEDDVEA